MADQSSSPIADHRRNNIDSLRLLAALAVLFAHCFVLVEPGTRDPITSTFQDAMPLQRGISGQAVALFFIVSGFLVTASFARREELSSYAAARLLRIMPALWVALAATVLAATVITTLSPGEFLTTGTTWSYLAHNATLFDLRDHLADVFTQNPRRDVNVSLWTLPLEFLMYMVVALVGVLGLIRHRRAFNAAVVVAFAGYVLADGKLPVIDDRHGSELLMYFVAGAAFYVNRDRLTLRAVPAVLLLAAAMALSLIDEPWAHVPVFFAFAYFVLWLGFTRRIRLPNLAAHGDLSYATYLYAAFVTQAWIWAVGTIDPWLLVLLTTAVTLPLAGLSWHFVEEPSLRLKGKLAGGFTALRGPRVAAAPPGAD